MELKYKEQKLRDLFVYHTGIYPKSIRIGRHGIVIAVSWKDLEDNGNYHTHIEQFLTNLVDRKVCIEILDQ